MGPVGRTLLTGRFPDPSSTGLQYTALLPSCSSPRCQRNIPYTKIRGFGMRTSYFHTSGILAMHFFLWDIPWIPKRSFWAGYWPAYVCGLGIPLLQLFLLLSIVRVGGVFLVSLIASRRKILFAYILAQTQYGTCNSNSYVLNYYCLWVHFS